jgi:hypothetical protein
MKKEVIEAINTLKVFLGMEKQEEVVKLAEQMKLDNGTTIEVDALEAGASVAIVNEDERIPLPKGEYSLEDGRILVATEDGVLSEVKEMEAEKEEEKEMKEVEEEAPMMSEEPVKEAKKVVESTVKETYFEEIEKLKAENEELKAKITELSKVEEVKEEVKEEVELSEEPKPIKANPENKTEKEAIRFGKQGKSKISSILEKVYN